MKYIVVSDCEKNILKARICATLYLRKALTSSRLVLIFLSIGIFVSDGGPTPAISQPLIRRG